MRISDAVLTLSLAALFLGCAYYLVVGANALSRCQETQSAETCAYIFR